MAPGTQTCSSLTRVTGTRWLRCSTIACFVCSSWPAGTGGKKREREAAQRQLEAEKGRKEQIPETATVEKRL